MQNRPGFPPEGSPVPQEKPDTPLNGYPAAGIGPDIDHIHGKIVTFMPMLDYPKKYIGVV
jgi:hypothetical protein